MQSNQKQQNNINHLDKDIHSPPRFPSLPTQKQRRLQIQFGSATLLQVGKFITQTSMT